jgi:pSer/pThr/pTyr-binding forkhead associated (FHA) protein
VSQRHATVRVEGAAYILLDEGSTNGTFVGEVRLSQGTPRTLRDGDLVRVGRVWLEVRIDQGPATLDLLAATRELAFKLVSDAMRSIGDDISPRIQVVEGPDRGRVLTLAEEGHSYLLGRGEDCDFLLDDPDGSREHLRVVRRGASVLVRDFGSKNGAWLGELRLPSERDTVWRASTMLRMGQNVMALEEPVAKALAELESAPDEPLPEKGSPPPPQPLAAPTLPRAESAPEAPLAEPPPARSSASSSSPPRKLTKAKRSGWSGADVAVLVVAISILALSAAGLYWLFRG